MSPPTAAFTYEPLDVGQHQIRLLKILPGEDDSMCCELKAFDLETIPEYTALSYTWGPPPPTFNVEINGNILKIRENLYNFLIEVRGKEEGYLWIDQICIDQSSVDEKSSQVRMMTKIYQACSSMISWIGDTSDEILKEAQRIADEEDRDVQLELPTALMYNRYYTRLWIVQEVALSPKIRVLVRGGVSVSWETMQELDWKEDKIPELASMILTTGEWVLRKDSLIMALNSFLSYGCEDPRDKVYGLMGLVHPNERLLVDYSKSTIDIFLDVLAAIWEDNHEYNINAMVLLNLGTAMGFNQHQMGGLYSLMENSLNGEERRAATGLKRSQVGYDPAGVGTGGGDISSENSSKLVDRWWFEINGRKHYHDCVADSLQEDQDT